MTIAFGLLIRGKDMRQRFTPAHWATASARHPRRVVAVWGVMLLVSVGIIATLLGSATTTEVSFVNTPESKQADQLIAGPIGIRSQDAETVVIQRVGGGAPPQAAVEQLAGRIERLGRSKVDSVVTPWNGGGSALISSDRSTVLLSVVMTGSETTAVNSVAKVVAIATAARSDGLQAQVTGQAAIGRDTNTTAGTDLQTGESIGIPVALIVLLFVFGTVVSALLPIGLAVAAIIVALALTSLVGHVYQLSFFVTNMITLMGLAVGIDYSLFIASRYRDERSAGSQVAAAIEIAGSTASRAVLFSGMTVVVALVGLLIVPSTIFLSLAIGAILVVLCAVAAAMTLLPATLVLLGDRLETGRIGRLLPRRLRRSGETARPAGAGFWTRAVGGVMHRPVLYGGTVVVLLIAAALPFASMKTGSSGVASLPHGLTSRQAYETLRGKFAVGNVAPARIPIVGNPASAANRAAIAQITRAVASDSIFGRPRLEPGAGPRGAVLDVPINADPTSARATAAITKLRAATPLPVTGEAAQNLDYYTISSNYQPIVFAIVLALSFIVLLLAFRSVVIPVVAIVMNLLSVGAAYGLLTLVTQKGYGAGVLGFQRVNVIEAWIPLFLFAVLFGLSMDYHVFLTSRIRERYDATGNTRLAISEGISSSAHLITGAALIMVAVFAGFAQGQLVMFQQMGFGLAVAILIDATLVRTVLVPAVMSLLGAANWYLPAWLAWLPNLSIEGRPAASVEPAGPEHGVPA
jgi:RND superfamily putative drug exporter